MKKIAALIMTFGIGLMLASPAFAKEEEGGPKAGDKGSFAGEIVKKDGGKITLADGGKTMEFFAYWRGGLPKDGGGFDKETVAKIKALERGQHVRIEWTFEEHYRIDSITKIGGGEKKPERREREERK